jgi:hypothetical protein
MEEGWRSAWCGRVRDEEDLGKRWERVREEIRSIQEGLGRGEGWGEGKDKSLRKG